MAVFDKTNKMNLPQNSITEKYETIAKNTFLSGEPTLRGNLLIRVIDTILLRIFGLLFGLGKKTDGTENEYYRLTGNFKRIGNIARKLTFLGPFNRLLMRFMMKNTVNMLGRQQLFGLNNIESTVHEAAQRYFIATDYFDFKIEVDEVNEDRVKFRFLECPIGYKRGDDMKLCMSTNKWDRQCVRMMGAWMIIRDLIPEGSPACVCFIVPNTEKIPEIWRRYKRLTI
jgi:hypothetical protein